MMRPSGLVPFLVCLALSATLVAAPPDDPFKALEFRSIGPALMGGRIDDVAVVESDPAIYYVATASGGIWKTTNHGTTFAPVFDRYETSSIGDVTVSPSNPSVVWAGSGEPNNRQSSSWGHGVYRSLDAGATWQHLGLEATFHIGRIVVHPRDEHTAWVAALGSLWGPGPERGLYRTTDGGKTWVNTKFIDEDTGFVDVAIDPESPNILYAASYQRRRTPFGFSGGGPSSGIWRTTDGGASWARLTSGLPGKGDLGRIGLAVYRRDPSIVFATIEHATEGGVYRSADRGETWTKVSSTNPRPSYYSKIHVDPNNELRIWVLGAQMYFSEDGGKTFKTDRIEKIHGDFHALWIDPANSDHLLIGSDGGIHVSWDGGRNMDFINTVALAQFYEVHYDMRTPYFVCGGLQDNGSWCGPSRTMYDQGIANEDWYRVGGGDGFFTVIDPSDPDTVYVESQDGNVQRFDRRTNQRRVIRPEPPAGEKYRFNWNSPIVLSPHDPKTIYYGGNRLFGSSDRGDTWTLVTPDLTSAQARDELPIFGKTSKDFLSRNDGVVHWGTITTIAESPVQRGVLWVGTDDGNLQLSRDGGASWTDVTARVTGVPKGTYVSRVEASRIGAGTAYVAFDGHRGNDFAPYVVRTGDFGQSWQRISAGLPQGGTVSVVREHPTKTDVLLAGTERGLFVSWSRGGEWTRVRANLPTMPVDDIQIHPRDNDLILASHGRGIWILDDMTPLLSPPAVTAPVEVLPIRPAVQYRIYGHKGNTGHKAFLGPNPPDGALVTYALNAAPAEKEKIKITVTDKDGAVVRTLEDAGKAGFNRTNWDLRYEPPVPPDPEATSFFGRTRGPLVVPGAYTVTVALGAASGQQTVEVREDPRTTVAAEERVAWTAACREAGELWRRSDAANKRLSNLKKQLEDQKAALGKDDKAPEELRTAVGGLLDRVTELGKKLTRSRQMGFAGASLADEPDPLVGRTRGLYSAVSSITAAPTSQQRELAARLSGEVDEMVATVNALISTDVSALNKQMFEAGYGRLDPGATID
jgi:photosystem II stability/assembly factor-like uncharacterized protein